MTASIIPSLDLALMDLGPGGDLYPGLKFVQEHLGDYVVGDMVCYAGRTNIGKSHLALAALSGAAHAGQPALYASLEDPKPRVKRRLANGYAHANLHTTFPSKSSKQILAVFRKAQKQYGVRHFCVDYMQKVRYEGDVQVWSKPDMMDVALTELEDGVAALDGVLHVVSQVTRPEKGADPGEFPKLYEMKESAAIENAADVVLILGNVKGRPTVEIAKAKDAPTGVRFAMVRDGATGVLREPDNNETRTDNVRQRKPDQQDDEQW